MLFQVNTYINGKGRFTFLSCIANSSCVDEHFHVFGFKPLYCTGKHDFNMICEKKFKVVWKRLKHSYDSKFYGDF